MTNGHIPWKPNQDVLYLCRDFRSVEDLIHVIQPYRISTGKGAYSTLQPTSKSVKITTDAINKMMEGEEA